jgi:hypothetical protein
MSARLKPRRRRQMFARCVEALEARQLLAVDFTMAAMSDTQYTVESFPNTFSAQTQWIADHATDPAYDFAFVAHQGDMLRRGYSDAQAAVADSALKILDNKVPYTVSIGNHDFDNQFDDLDHHISSANFTSWFGNARYQAIGNSGFGGASLDQRNRYQIFTAGGQQFLVLSLEWEAPDAALAWAQTVVNGHRQLPVIVTTHEYLNSSGRTTSPLDPAGNAGASIFSKFVAKNPQVFMVLSGHTGAVFSQTSTNNAGATVYEYAADFEGRPNGGDGWMQLLQFDLAGGKITGSNYSPTLNQTQAATTYSNINFAQRFSFYAAGAPIGNDDTLDTAPGQTVSFDPRDNDFDPDADAHAASVSFSALPAGVSYDGTSGLFSFAPAADFRGDVSFTYTLTDTDAHVGNTATVTLRANNAPVASADAAATPESKAVTINVLANDADDNAADNAALRPILASLPSHGAVFANADGTFTYTPDPKFVGQDSFGYTLSDGKMTASPVAVSVNVRPAAPVYDYPIAETTAAGTRTGAIANLGASDNSVESIKEVYSTGSDLDQRWRFNVTGGSDVTLAINAWRSFSNQSTGDEYHMQYSTDGATWSDLTRLVPSGSKDITRTKFEANEPYQMWALPAGTKGTVWIRATDTINGSSSSEILDTLTVDEIFIRSGVDFPQVSIGATDGAETLSNSRPVTFTVSRSGSASSIRNPLTVFYTLSGTATPGDDYTPASDSFVTIPAGAASVSFSITPIADSLSEGTETIVATLSSDNAYDLAAQSTATANVADLSSDTTPPSAPTLSASTTSTSAKLVWTASTDDVGVVAYDVFRNGVLIASTAGAATSYTDGNLPSSTSFTYTVQARDDAGNTSVLSNAVTAITRLAAPGSLTGSKVKNKQVKLTWRDNSTTETAFYVYSSRDGINWTKVATVAPLSGSGGTATWTSGTLANGLWYFKVTATDANGESDPSNIFSITL